MSFNQLGNRLVWQSGQEKIQIEPWGFNSVRIRGKLNGSVDNDDQLSALQERPLSTPTIRIEEHKASLQNGNLLTEISTNGTIRFINSETQTELLSEIEQKFPQPERRFKQIQGDHFRIQQRFMAYDDEKFYGLGQQKHGKLNQKGCVIDLLQLNSHVSIPFMISSRGYGFLWNNPAVGRVELGHNHTRWIAETTTKLDYWITIGDVPSQILENYMVATGHPPMIPEWAVGFWQSKLRYSSQQEILDVAHQYKSRGLPLSVIVIDYFHWTLQGDWQFDTEFWPDPGEMVRELESMGIKVMVSVWPTVNSASQNYQTLREQGFLIDTNRGVPAHWILTDANAPGLPAPVQFYDATHPGAQVFLWERIREGYYEHGIEAFWLDACEPEMYPTDPENLRYHLGNGLAVTNIYPRFHAQAFYEGLKSAGTSEILTLCRSAWAGSQKFGAAVWSGDIASTFEELAGQVKAGLNIGLSGIAWWTTDIGGFHSGDPSTPYFQELIVRWFQFGVFCPLFRLHGFRLPADLDRYWESGGDNEVWSFGQTSYEIIADLLHLRKRLKPYILELMAEAHKKGTPPMRPLFYDFPHDKEAWQIDDQYMFGPDLLVAPVLIENACNRQVYLPEGDIWRDAWTDENLAGGQTITVETPLAKIPLYLRGDTKLQILV